MSTIFDDAEAQTVVEPTRMVTTLTALDTSAPILTVTWDLSTGRGEIGGDGVKGEISIDEFVDQTPEEANERSYAWWTEYRNATESRSSEASYPEGENVPYGTVCGPRRVSCCCWEVQCWGCVSDGMGHDYCYLEVGPRWCASPCPYMCT